MLETAIELVSLIIEIAVLLFLYTFILWFVFRMDKLVK